jgi:hypothetical protein
VAEGPFTGRARRRTGVPTMAGIRSWPDAMVNPRHLPNSLCGKRADYTGAVHHIQNGKVALPNKSKPEVG